MKCPFCNQVRQHWLHAKRNVRQVACCAMFAVAQLRGHDEMPETLDVDRIAHEALKPRDQRSGAALDNGQFDVWPPLFWQLPRPNIARLITDVGSGSAV